MNENLSILVSRFARFDRDLSKATGLIARELGAVMKLAAVRKLKDGGTWFRGHLAGSLAWSQQTDGADSNASTRGVLMSELPYATTIDLGRRPGARMPPPVALIPWIKKKWALKGTALRKAGARAKRRTKAGVARPYSEENVYLRAAFVLARSIKKKGIVGRRFGAAAIEGAKAAASRVVAATVAQVLRGRAAS